MENERKPKRLESLDILRGFDMFFIFLPDPAPCVCAVALAAFGLGDSAFAAQFDHVSWAGFHFYDLIFPLFLFISGVTWPFSCSSQVAKGVPKGRIVQKVLKRALLLFLLGLMVQTRIDGVQEYSILSFNFKFVRLWSVIGRIGIAWGFAALFYLFLKQRARIAVCAAILGVMYFLVRFGVAPGAPDGIDPLVEREWMLCRWIDANYLGNGFFRGGGGFVTITMVATAMFGVFAGEILRNAAESLERRAVKLSITAGVLIALGLFMAFGLGEWSLPIIKGCWSSSFALFAGGLSFGLLAFFFWVVDIRGWRRWGFFFKIIGMNALTIYVLVRTVLNYEFLKGYFFGGMISVLPPVWGELVAQIGLIGLGWLLLYYLYRKNIFLRV